MALVHCTECGREISDQAIACPQCGYPRRRTAPMTRGIKFLLAALVLMLVGMFAFAIVAAWIMRQPVSVELPSGDASPTSLKSDCMPHDVCAPTRIASS